MAKEKLAPEVKEAINNLIREATKKTKAGEHEEAVELLEQVLELKPDDTRALDLLGYVQWSLGRLAEAEETNRRSLAIKPLNAYARKGLGVCLAEQGRVDEGISELHHAMALKPLWADPVHDLVVVLYKAGRYEQALPMIERALEIDPALETKLGPIRAECEAKIAASSEAEDRVEDGGE